MATKKILVSRAKVASKLSSHSLDRDFALGLKRLAPVDSDGDLVIIPAAPEESAVVVIHRMDHVPGEKIAVATMLGTTLHVRSFRRVPLDRIPNKESIGGGVTVAEWFERIIAKGTYSFAADGIEFAAELSNGSLTAA